MLVFLQRLHISFMHLYVAVSIAVLGWTGTLWTPIFTNASPAHLHVTSIQKTLQLTISNIFTIQQFCFNCSSGILTPLVLLRNFWRVMQLTSFCFLLVGIVYNNSCFHSVMSSVSKPALFFSQCSFHLRTHSSFPSFFILSCLGLSVCLTALLELISGLSLSFIIQFIFTLISFQNSLTSIHWMFVDYVMLLRSKYTIFPPILILNPFHTITSHLFFCLSHVIVLQKKKD